MTDDEIRWTWPTYEMDAVRRRAIYRQWADEEDDPYYAAEFRRLARSPRERFARVADVWWPVWVLTALAGTVLALIWVWVA